MPIITIDCSALINGTRIFGTLEFIGPTTAAAKAAHPSYAGDLEQCDDCGCDAYDVIRCSATLATMSGYALRCRRCESIYALRSEE